MQIEENQPDNPLSITAYGAAGIEINGESYKHPICLTQNGIAAVPTASPQELTAESFLEYLRHNLHHPEVILVGTGSKHAFLHPKITVRLAAEGIGLESMTTAAACRTFTILQGEGRKVWAWLWP